LTLHLYNTLTRHKEKFEPVDAKKLRMYVCGPTVYDRPHIGNARSVVVYDVLYRLLCHLYGGKHVNFVRNITDVDDKINARAKEMGVSIQLLTSQVTAQFHHDMDALFCLRPAHEPRATQHIREMHAIIRKLIDNGHAYVAQSHVLFDVGSVPHYHPGEPPSPLRYVYGMLSHRVQDEQQAGARIEVEKYKKNPGDFVLWKPAEEGDDPSSVFESPWGPGRPGWHIECSAMSSAYLGNTFDIHGGGSDLMFPHHENEIAQSRCADKTALFARYWVHNGFLTVNGEKMSKSLGNFITVHDLLEKGVRGEDIRLALLSARYNEPLDWNDKLLHDARTVLDKWYRRLREVKKHGDDVPPAFAEALGDDMNLPLAISILHEAEPAQMKAMGAILGFFNMEAEERFKGGQEDAAIQRLIDERNAARKARNFAEADRLRKELADQGIILEDRAGGKTDWRRR